MTAARRFELNPKLAAHSFGREDKIDRTAELLRNQIANEADAVSVFG